MYFLNLLDELYGKKYVCVCVLSPFLMYISLDLLLDVVGENPGVNLQLSKVLIQLRTFQLWLLPQNNMDTGWVKKHPTKIIDKPMYNEVLQ